MLKSVWATALPALVIACSSTSTNEGGTGGSAPGGGQAIRCAALSGGCDPAQGVCCYDGPTGVGSCAPLGQCAATSLSYACDDQVDCVAAAKPPGYVCCANVDGYAIMLGSACAATCAPPMHRLCNPQAPGDECPTGQSCKPMAGVSPPGYYHCE